MIEKLTVFQGNKELFIQWMLLLCTWWVCQNKCPIQKAWHYLDIRFCSLSPLHYNHNDHHCHPVLSLPGEVPFLQRQPSLLFGDYLNLMSTNWHSQHLLSHLKCSWFFKSDSQAWQFPSTYCQFSMGSGFCLSVFLPGHVFSICLMCCFQDPLVLTPHLFFLYHPGFCATHWLLGLGNLGTRVLAITCDQALTRY